MTGIVTLSCMLDAVHNETSSKDFSYFKKVYDSFTHMVHAIGSLGSDSCSGSIIRWVYGRMRQTLITLILIMTI